MTELKPYGDLRKHILARPSACALELAKQVAGLQAELALRGYPPHVADKAVELAADLARYSNKSTQEAVAAIRSALRV